MFKLSDLTFLQKLMLAAAAGLLNWAVFPKPGLWPLVWFCQVPLLLASFRETSTARSLLFGLVTGLCFFVGTCHWIAAVLRNYGGLSWAGGELLFLLLALYLSSFYALFAWAFAKLAVRDGRLCFWMAPALWVSAEYLRAHVLTGFPWCLLGYGLVDAANLAQIASLTGVYGLSFAATSVNALAAEAMLHPSRPAVYRLGGVASALGCLALGFAWTGEKHTEATHLVRIVQTNIDLEQKWDAASKASLLDELTSLSVPSTERQVKPQSEPVRLILWPETPAAFYFNHDIEFRRRMEKVAASSGAYFLFGFVDFRPGSKSSSQRDPFNSVALLSPEGKTIAQYDKIHLVPFGEYIPYEQLFFFVNKISTETGNFKAGSRVVVSKLDNQRALGSFVCYEAVVPDLVRQFARNGSQLFVNVTNDAWFGESPAPWQHFAMARMRAIENHRYLLRAANNGISAIVDPCGRVLKTLQRNERTVLEGAFGFETRLTPYAQYGDVFAWMCLIMSVGVMGVRVKGRGEPTP